MSDYVIVEQLFKGLRVEVYRVLQKQQKKHFIIKVLCQKYPTVEELVQFHNQYIITRYLNHPNILCPIALEQYDNSYALIMPDEGFISLQDYSQKQCFKVSEVLTIAIQLADALHYLTGKQVIHKDIKPGNIIIHPETKQVQLIDFSIASLLPKEHQQIANPQLLEGTVAYISPEQTGRMNRGIDYRTDFYSLGVTLFELLEGEPPFLTDNAIE